MLNTSAIFNKIIGWSLLVLGLALVVFAVYSAFGVFMAKKPVPEIFQITKQEPICPQAEKQIVNGNKTQQEIQEQIEKIIQGQMSQQIKEFIPPEFISKILNLVSFALFITILVFAGGQIAGMGVKLLKINL